MFPFKTSIRNKAMAFIIVSYDRLVAQRSCPRRSRHLSAIGNYASLIPGNRHDEPVEARRIFSAFTLF
jgi:hypothetical protein